jgi:2-hydroxy-4-carboxymuconate semialdehyde hemiacetal dehydrogenase
MSKSMKVALAGAGAFGLRHLDGIQLIGGVEVISVVGRELEKTLGTARKYGVGHATTDLADTLKLPGLDAVILATPTQMHAAQALQCLEAGKHVQVEIPLADSLRDAEAVVAMQKRTGLVATCGHTRRFNPKPPVRSPANSGERVPHPADGRADLFLPPHQHERTRPAAILDRPLAVAP